MSAQTIEWLIALLPLAASAGGLVVVLLTEKRKREQGRWG